MANEVRPCSRKWENNIKTIEGDCDGTRETERERERRSEPIGNQ